MKTKCRLGRQWYVPGGGCCGVVCRGAMVTGGWSDPAGGPTRVPPGEATLSRAGTVRTYLSHGWLWIVGGVRSVDPGRAETEGLGLGDD